jgi:gamma-glutamyltranspeptidase/glutathione hydrolase
MRTRVLAAVLVVALLAPNLVTAQADSSVLASNRGMVVSVHYLASDIGADVLAKGGNAIDAAVATAFALAVTHPSAGNIGGGGFMVIRLKDGRATTIDYREKAPASATPTMFLLPNGTINRAITDSGWSSPGVPGTVRGLALAHQRYGKLPWKDVVAPAAELAAKGFALSKALAEELNEETSRGQLHPFPTSTAAYAKAGGGLWKAGETIRLPQLARALDAIATSGPDAFYTGWIADSIDAQMRAHRGLIRKEDLAAYRAVERPPVRGMFLGHEIISMGPPSSGGTVLVMTLNMLENLGIQHVQRGSAEYFHDRIEVARRAYLDRARFLGDSDFVKVPLDRLLSKEHAAELVATIRADKASSSVELGREIVTPGAETMQTTHFSVIDAEGNAVSNTYTLEGGYGSGIVVAGFILNNEMGDFNKKPGTTNTGGDIGTPPNVLAPQKRMLSSMTPAIVTKDGKVRLITGSPGGRTIPNTVINVVLGVTAYGLDVRSAVDAPRLHHQWLPDTTLFEPGAASPKVLAALRAKGHAIKVLGGRWQGDAHSIIIDPLTGVARGANDTRSNDSRASAPKR